MLFAIAVLIFSLAFLIVRIMFFVFFIMFGKTSMFFFPLAFDYSLQIMFFA